ncbi:aspartate aminotransferase family protein [Ascidiimonas aurantiaca]|uniref:aspartate aminotransferase family protein n=1 Tax=Ascidiimonas aurantiaca TaxID=1685432 RepID=UPI0030EF0D1C
MTLFDVYPLYDVTPVKGRDVYIYDDTGTEYLDLYGGHAVISIGHSHPQYVEKITSQIQKLGFYSNAVKNPLQVELANLLGKISGCYEYQLFMCNSGAEANENALKLASFQTGKSHVIAFNNAFHGRTSAAVAVTDNAGINAPVNKQHEVTFLALGDLEALEQALSKNHICAVIIECIQGVGGLDEAHHDFYTSLAFLCKKYNTLLIADEVQSGFGRTGDFFAFQKHGITPDIISIAKGMGNGFPVGGILIHPDIEPVYGMLGTTFGGNHLACSASIAVLEILSREHLMENAISMDQYFNEQIAFVPQIKRIKGRGLMLGLEFDFEVNDLRKQLIYRHHIFTGGSANRKLLRMLPPLTLQKTHIDHFVNALKTELS